MLRKHSHLLGNLVRIINRNVHTKVSSQDTIRNIGILAHIDAGEYINYSKFTIFSHF